MLMEYPSRRLSPAKFVGQPPSAIIGDQPVPSVSAEYHVHLEALNKLTQDLVERTKQLAHTKEEHHTRQFVAKMQQQEKKTGKAEIFDREIMSVERVKTGVKGLDELIEGGVPERSVVLVTGSTGTGKTIFAMNYLVAGALMDEPGVYISLQESPQENINQMKLFGWPIERLIEERKVMMIQPEMYNFEALLSVIEESVEKIHAKRLVIDSASLIGLYFENPYKVRKARLDLGQLLKRLGCTTLALDEIKESETTLSAFGVEEFVADGVIVLYYLRRANFFMRAMTIRKLRSTCHSQKIHPMEIRRPGGIVIYASEEVFGSIE